MRMNTTNIPSNEYEELIRDSEKVRILTQVMQDRVDPGEYWMSVILGIQKEVEIKNVVRKGEKPVVQQCYHYVDLKKFIDEIVSKYPNDKIAILTKTEKEATILKKIVPNFKLIKDDADDELLTSKYTITTIYISKGLEFDRVIVTNVDQDNYKTLLDRNNLYVACTRPLHALYITYQNKPSKFLPV